MILGAGVAVLGVQLPIVIGIGGLLLGVVALIAQWIFMPEFFRRKPEVVDASVLASAPAGRTS